MGSPKDDDVCSSRPRLLLSHDHDLDRTFRDFQWFICEAICVRFSGLLLSVLCFREYTIGQVEKHIANTRQFGIGFQGVPWLYPTEINSLAMRTKGAAIATATNWM